METNIVFIDIETTGLSADLSALTLLGAKPKNGDVKQWFNSSGLDQKDILKDFIAYLTPFDTIITFNGSTFDLPYLTKKCEAYNLPNIFKEKKHIDMYQQLKSIKHLFSWKNLKQKNLESYVGFHRKDCLSSKAMIKTYQDYLDTKEERKRSQLFLHNKEDLLGLESIYSLLCFQSILEGKYQVTSAILDTALTIEFKTSTIIPVDLNIEKNHLHFTLQKDKGVLTCPLFNDFVAHYYPNTKDYYYLPNDQVLLPKSMGQTIPRALRKHPTPDQCFTYFKPSKEFLKQMEHLHTLCSHNISYILRKDTNFPIIFHTK